MSTAIAILQALSLAGLVVLFRSVAKLADAYGAKKGENLATQEDIATITREIESVRAEYSRGLEELAHQNRLLLEFQNPATAEETLRRETFVRAKLDAYHQAIDILARVFASMAWSEPNAASRGAPTPPPAEWEMNAALARLGIVADEPEVFDEFMGAARGGDELIGHYRRFIELARLDMRFGGTSLAATKLKYIFGRKP